MTNDDHSTGDNQEESVIEHAMRMSQQERVVGEDPRRSEVFGREDHLDIARSGAADLSLHEKNELLRDLAQKESPRRDASQSRSIPLFFGSWSGMNPFRFVKPFFVTRLKGER